MKFTFVGSADGAGSANGEMQCLTVPILSDSILEGNETFEVVMVLWTMEDCFTLENSNTTVTIEDSQGK